MAFEVKQQWQLNKIIVIPLVLSAMFIITNMLNQSLTALTSPTCLLSQVQTAHTLNDYCTVREFLNGVHVSDEEADNCQPHHSTMFPALYSHFNVP